MNLQCQGANSWNVQRELPSLPTSEKPKGMFYNFAHYHARTPCSLHGASAYFRHHSSFEIVCGSAFVNGCERTKLCHSAVGLYPSQPISRLAHYSYFPTNLLGIEIGACVVGIYPTASPTDCATSIIVGNPIYCWAATKYASIKAFGKSKKWLGLRSYPCGLGRAVMPH